MDTKVLCTMVLGSFFWLVKVQAQKDHHKLLLVSFDGVRWDFPDRASELEGFRYLKENGVKADFLRCTFPSLTSPTHFSVATGLYTESHGVVHNSFYDPKSHVGFVELPDYHETLTINEWWDNGAEPIWITAVNQGLKSGGYKFPGSYATIKGVSATMKDLDTAAVGRSEEAWRQQIVECMEWFTTHGLDMIAMYFEQPDYDLHQFGPENDYVFETSLPIMSRTIMYLIEQVEKYGLSDKLNIIIHSDHGFDAIDTSVKPDDAISLAKYVDESYVKFMNIIGPIGLIEPTSGNAEYVAEKLRKGNPNMTVYLKEEIPERFHYKNNDRVPSILVLANSGHAIYANFPNVHAYKGHHGYDNALKNMGAIYYSIGPSFKKGYEIKGFDSVHIYSLMCHLLGLDPAPNNGSLEVLSETLVERTTVNNYSGFALTFCVLLMTAFGFTRIRHLF